MLPVIFIVRLQTTIFQQSQQLSSNGLLLWRRKSDPTIPPSAVTKTKENPCFPIGPSQILFNKIYTTRRNCKNHIVSRFATLDLSMTHTREEFNTSTFTFRKYKAQSVLRTRDTRHVFWLQENRRTCDRFREPESSPLWLL